MILAVGCVVGFAVAWAAGANPRLLSDVRLRWTGLVLAALGVQVAMFAVGVALPIGISSTNVHVASYVLLLVFAARNGRVPGFALAGLGLACNAAAIFLNGGRMPVSAEAWAESTGTDVASQAGHVHNNVATMDAGTHLGFLGDVFAIPHGIPLANTFSIGDILLVMGATLFVFRSGRSNRDRPSSGAFEPLAVPAFRALLAGRTVSKLGDWVSVAALVTWIYAHSHSTFGVSAILVARLTASIAGGLVGSVVLDRFGRFAILARVEAARALITLGAVALVAADHAYVVAACVFGSSFLAAATDPAASSLVAELLPPRTVHAGNALHAVARAAVMAAGSVAGGLVAASLGAVPALAADCGTFLVAFALYALYARRAAPIVPRPAASDVAGGTRLDALRSICGNRTLAALVGSFAIATFAMGLLNASLPAFMSVHAPHAGGYGVAIGVIAVGLVCGEFLSGRASVRVVERIPALGFVLTAAAVSVAAASQLPATVLLLLFLLGVGDGTTETAYDTVVQREAPSLLSGRVFALAGAVQQTAMVAGLVAAPILQRAMPDDALSVSGLALGVSAVVALLVLVERRPAAAARQAAVH